MWFIISLVYMQFGNVQPEILVYKAVYKDKASCQKVYQEQPQKFMDEIFMLRPKAKSMSFSCVDKQLLNELKLSNKVKKL